MGQMGAVALQDLHRLQRRLEVAGRAQVVAVQVQRVRQAQVVHDAGQGRDDLRRRHLAVAGNRLEQALGVLAPLPRRDAAGVDGLHSVSLGRPDVPGRDVPRPLQLAFLDQVEQDLVVGHQDAAGLIDDGRVAQLLVGVPGREDRHGRLVHGGVAESGVEVAGDEGGRGRSADAAAAHRRADERGVAAMVLRDHGAGEVEGGAGDMGVNVHAAGENDHARRIDGAAVRHVGDDPAVRDADVADLAVDVVGRIVDFAAFNPQHGISTHLLLL